MTRPCSDGCGRTVKNYTEECSPVAPWDSPGLPPRPMGERCTTHAGRATGEKKTLCVYRDDDPARCNNCHSLNEKCICGQNKWKSDGIQE